MDKESGVKMATVSPVPSPESRLRILTFFPYFYPNSGVVGPGRSLINIAERLGQHCLLQIITNGCQAPDKNTGDKVSIQLANSPMVVHYHSHWDFTPWRLPSLIRAIPHDIIYLNSAFRLTTIMSLLLRRLGCLGSNQPVILAVRGEFRPAALATKALKKACFLWFTKAIGLYRQVIWQATNQAEESEIRRVMGPTITVKVAGNLIQPTNLPAPITERQSKEPGKLKCIYLSRIYYSKNLLFVLSCLKELSGDIELDIYAHIEDELYWSKCQDQMKLLPSNIRVRYCGVIPADQVLATFSRYHLFIFPTFWESFGHVIMESFMAGCPVLTSDQTPWRNLSEKGIGWDCPLEDPEAFRQVIRQCLAMSSTELQAWSLRAHTFAMAYATDTQVLGDHLTLFHYAARQGQKTLEDALPAAKS